MHSGSEKDRVEQLRFLGLFYYGLGVLGIPHSFLPLLSTYLGLLFTDLSVGGGPFAGVFGSLFAVVGVAYAVAGVVFSILLILAGKYLRAQRHYTFCVAVAACSCAAVPLGTILGIVTLVQLAKDDAKAGFAQPAA
jgi:hypothetical protein